MRPASRPAEATLELLWLAQSPMSSDGAVPSCASGRSGFRSCGGDRTEVGLRGGYRWRSGVGRRRLVSGDPVRSGGIAEAVQDDRSEDDEGREVEDPLAVGGMSS